MKCPFPAGSGGVTVPRMRSRAWRRVGSTRRVVVGRAVLSGIAAGVGVFGFIAAITDGRQSSDYIWPLVLLFVAWRFFRLGLYTSAWGVRICNPVLAWWYPWSRVARFELASTGELFAPKAKGIALVTTAGKRRLSWDLTTSGLLIRLSSDAQGILLDELNELSAAQTSPYENA